MSSITVPPALDAPSAILRVFGAHPFHTDGDLLALAFAPDGTLWSVEDAGVLRHWDLAAGQQLGWHHLEELAILWTFSPDAKLVAAGGDELSAWDVASGEVLTTWPQPEWVTALAFHPHLNRIATAHETRKQGRRSVNTTGEVRYQRERRKDKRTFDSVVRIWDVKNERPIQEFRVPKSAISAIAFSGDGTKLATAGEDKTIHLWDLEKGGVLCGSLVGHTDRVTALAWHPDGKRILSSGWDTTARVWDVQTCEPIILLNSHAMQVHGLALNKSGSRLACADSANAVHIWDLEHYLTVRVLRDHGNEIRLLAFSPDEQKLAFGGAEHVIHVWDERKQPAEESLSEPTAARTTLAVRANGKQLVSLGTGTTLRIWDTAKGDNVLSLEGAGVLGGFAASPDGAWYAASLTGAEAAKKAASLGLWNAMTGKRVRMLEGPKPPITALAFSPDSTMLAASGSQSADVWVWKVQDHEPALLIPEATAGCSVEALAWHPLTLHAPSSKSGAGRLRGQILACAGIDWLSTGGSDGRVTLWDIGEHKKIGSFRGGATNVVFHPNGKKLAATSLKNTVRVWDIETERGFELIGHFDAVTCLAYRPDGEILATGSDDHTIRFWEADSGTERGKIELDSQIKALAFSPDGRYLYSGNGNTSCYQMDVERALSGLEA